ncbi:MAG: helix-turn-helix domain-containing protein [Sphingosinicella sp.]
MSDSFHFSSVGRDGEEAFADYAAIFGRGSKIEPADAPFQAEVRAWRLNGLALYDRRLSGVVHQRDSDRCADGLDHLLVHAIVEGEVHGGDGAGFDRVGPGEIVLIDMAQPARFVPHEAHLLTVRVAREHFAAALGASVQHGRVLEGPATMVPIDLLRSLVRWSRTAGGPTHSQFRALLALLAGAAGPESLAAADRRWQEQVRSESVYRYVDSHLASRDLSVSAIAAAVRMSRSALYRLLDEAGGVRRFVQARRLAALRHELESERDERLESLAHRFGFASETHMSRLFSAAFGRPPGAWRRERRSDHAAAPESAPAWVGESI